MRLKFILAILFVGTLAAFGRTVGQAVPAKVQPQQEKQAQALPATLQAAFCKIDVVNKTFLVLPWDEKTRKLKRDSFRVLAWNDQTRLVSEPDSLTMREFISGKPLGNGTKDVAGILGKRGLFYITKIEGREVVQKAEMLANFAWEPSPAVGGNYGVEVLGPPDRVTCGSNSN